MENKKEIFTEELRKKFFKECTDKYVENVGISNCLQIHKVNLTPHNVFEWFKNNIKDV